MSKFSLLNFSYMVVMASEAKKSFLPSSGLTSSPSHLALPSSLPCFLSREVNCPFVYWTISLNHNSLFIIHINWHAIILIYGAQCDM